MATSPTLRPAGRSSHHEAPKRHPRSGFPGLSLVADGMGPTPRPVVVAVASSYRLGTIHGAVIHSVADAASRHGLATVVPLDALPRLPHFDVLAPYPIVRRRLRQTDDLFDRADAVLFCVAEYAEGLPSMIGNLLEWAIADGFLCHKKVGWINVATGVRRGRAAHEALERALAFAGADIVVRCDIPLGTTDLSLTGRLRDPATTDRLIAALNRLLPPTP